MKWNLQNTLKFNLLAVVCGLGTGIIGLSGVSSQSYAARDGLDSRNREFDYNLYDRSELGRTGDRLFSEWRHRVRLRVDSGSFYFTWFFHGGSVDSEFDQKVQKIITCRLRVAILIAKEMCSTW